MGPGLRNEWYLHDPIFLFYIMRLVSDLLIMPTCTCSSTDTNLVCNFDIVGLVMFNLLKTVNSSSSFDSSFLMIGVVSYLIIVHCYS